MRASELPHHATAKEYARMSEGEKSAAIVTQRHISQYFSQYFSLYHPLFIHVVGASLLLVRYS